MNSEELRKKFLRFFEKRGHTIVSSSSLLPSDPSVLFTTAGMQQFKPYYLGKPSPFGKNVSSCQRCFRTTDINSVGDERHLTFFEMLGNFSFGGYGKKRAIFLAKEFLDLLKIKIDYVTVFGGDENLPPDEETAKIWKRLGFSKEKGNLKFCPKEENFWGPTGEEGPCGPTTEIYSKGIELWNIVFNQYYHHQDKKLTPLKILGVDTGMGLERLAMISQRKNSIFETDLFAPLLKELNKIISNHQREKRIVVDHIKAGVFLISEGVFPSNVERGYVLRRLLRRAIRYGKLMKLSLSVFFVLVKRVIEIYQNVYPELRNKETDILTIFQKEAETFEKALERGLRILKKEISKIKNQKEKVIPGEILFDLYQSYGFPIELTEEIAKENNLGLDFEGFKKKFELHKKISAKSAERKFGGVGESPTLSSIKLHTATHLLHSALRKILGEHVRQLGSDITPQRLRFDFSHPKKLTQEEIKKIEELVNQKIRENLKVEKREMTLKEALEAGALAFFKERYPERVTVYFIGDFSKEICRGPHVKSTGELKRFKIIKEEGIGAGKRRIKAILEEK